MPDHPLRNQVAVVAGATRGAGRGIARMLGAAGATVYCTGRSVRGRPATPGRPETIEETAELVTAEGGRGIAVRTDHTVESEVEQLFARVRAEAGRLDVLVNDIWGGDALTEWGKPFWELSITQGQQMLERAVHSHLITSRHGAPLMIERDAGLIVEVTDGDTLGYRGNLFYDLAKNAVIRLAYADGRRPPCPPGDRAGDHPWIPAVRGRPRLLRGHRGELAGRHRRGSLLRGVRDAVPGREGRGGAGRRPERRREERRPVLYLDAFEGVRPDRCGRPTAGLGHLLSAQGAGDRRWGRGDGDEHFHRPQSRLYQVELDPGAAEEGERLRTWLGGHE